MGTKFSEDIVPLSDLKVNPGKVVSHAQETHRPVLLTSRGPGWLWSDHSWTMRKKLKSALLCRES
jgi:hypothetical protein